MRTIYLIIIFVLFILGAYRAKKVFAVQTGIDPDVMGNTKSPIQKLSRSLFALISAGYIIELTLVVSSSERLFDPPTFPGIFNEWYALLGFILSLGALWFIGRARKEMGASWRIGVDGREKTELITGGPFAYVRNPVFIGIIFLLGAIILIIPHWLSVILWTANSITIAYQVRVEEDRLVESHGRRYLDYAERVGRFLPYLGRLKG